MSTETPIKQRDNLHDEEGSKPRFDYAGSPEDISRQQKTAAEPPKPGEPGYDPQKTPLLDKSDPRSELSPKQLKEKEQGASSNLSSKRASKADGQGFFSGNETPGRFSFSRLRGKITKRRAAIGVTAVVLGGSGFAGFAILQGPFQFIHLSQNLQKFFKNNEDFGNDRTSKTLLYALAGKGIEGSRLGVTGNAAANKWEEKLIKDTGMRPVYQNPGRRFVGFEILDEKKAAGVLEDLGDKDNKRINKTLDNGIEIVDSNDVTDARGNKLDISGSDGKVGKNRILNLSKTDFAGRRAWIKSIGRATKVNNVVGSQASRLLIKRAGVKFHVMNKLTEWTDQKRAEFREKRNKEIEDGAKEQRTPTADNSKDTDGDGKADSADAADVETSDETKKFLEDFKKTGTFKGAASAAAVAGLLCAVKQYGEIIPEYKWDNIAKPVMRIGTEAISAGDQVKSLDDFNLGSMGVMVGYLQDRENNTSFNQSAGWRSLEGKDGGIPPDPETDLHNVGDKPKLFDIVDGIPGLGTVCSIQEGIFGLPGIKQIAGFAGDITGAFIDAGLGAFGTSKEALIQSSLRVVAGKSVDPEKIKGAAYGNAAVIGSNLAANDTAIAMGGGLLTDADVAELDLVNQADRQDDRATESFFAKYIDPFNSDTLVAAAIDNAPATPSQYAAELVNPLNGISKLIGSFGQALWPGAHAQAATKFNPGFKQYGFSLSERQDARFEDPYENAKIVEPQLEALNDKYSACFGLKIVPGDDGGVKVENGKSVNIFNFPENGGKGLDGCNRPKKGTPAYTMFLRYRFYIADSITALSVACYYDTNCVAIDVDNNQGTDPADAGTGNTEPPASINGYTLTPNERTHLKYIAENILSKLSGDAAKTAAESAWWALREGVLDLSDPFGYSNCGSGDGNTHIGVVATCSASTWQVGIGGVQVPNWTSAQVIAMAKKVNPGKTVKEILAGVATLAGYNEGTTVYNQIVNSTGTLQKSLLLRDPATGIALVNRDVQPCFTQSPPSWCLGGKTGIAGNKQDIQKSVTELSNYFAGASNGSGTIVGDITASSVDIPCASGTTDLGIQDGYTNGSLVKIKICAVKNFPSTGEESNGGYGVSGANGDVVVNSRVSGAVAAMVAAAKADGVNLTAISSFRSMAHQNALCPCDGITVAHPGFSNHQLGVAIDFGGGLPSTPGPIPGNKFWEWLSANAGKYGYKNYPREAWHWSPTGH